MLRSDGDMPIGYGAFLDACKGNVSASKLALLRELTPDAEKGPLLSEWAAFHRMFKAELAFQRNQRLGRPAGDMIFHDEAIQKAVGAALSNPNPLEAENDLLAFQFEKLDTLIGIHAFDDVALMGYALKLKLLERKTVFRQDEGSNELNRLVDGLKAQISSME